MKKLDTEYIEQHLETVHTYESFGRSVCEGILSAALKRVKGNSEETIHLTSDITVRPTPRLCIQVCKMINGQHRTVHIYTSPQ
ncbi:hypothetical protein KFD70_27535 [Bacillus pfraonensis]|uniref:hypothetical protein n=1 Tax=Bacillus TaxID=1386 RepID=UPI003012F29E